MKLHPNTTYYQIKISLLNNELISIFYKKELKWYRLKEAIEVPAFYLTEEQYENKQELLFEVHMTVALRKAYGNWELGHVEADLDENGEIIDKTWKWIPGYIDPSEFHLGAVPYYIKKVKLVTTDHNGDLILNNA